MKIINKLSDIETLQTKEPELESLMEAIEEYFCELYLIKLVRRHSTPLPSMTRAALGPPCPDLAHPWAPALPLHPFKNYSGPCYELKINLNNGLQPESSFIGWLTQTPTTKP